MHNKAEYIKQGYNFGEKDEETVKGMQEDLLRNRETLKDLGWANYPKRSKVLKAKAYLIALENYIFIKKQK